MGGIRSKHEPGGVPPCVFEDALEALVGPETRGDPQSPLKWTTKSLGNLVNGLYAKGFEARKKTVARLLKQAGYRLQRTFKTKEGAGHPDRDAQFGHINATAAGFLAAGDPVISVDTKKKELVGEYANGGREPATLRDRLAAEEIRAEDRAPTAAQWAAGDRIVICAAVAGIHMGPLTKSLF